MRKIVIAPIFNEAPFLKAWLDNMNEILEPSLIILNEGCFPKGPEANKVLDKNYVMSYTYGDGKRSFDFDEIEKIIKPYSNVILNEMDYTGIEPSQAYSYSLIHCLPVEMPKTTLIFPLEVDIFLHEDDKEKIDSALKRIDKAATIEYIRFFAPTIEMMPRKRRKFVFRWNDGTFYKEWITNHFFGRGDNLRDPQFKALNINGYHFEWFRQGKYFDARIAQLPRHGRIRDELYMLKDYYERYGEIADDIILNRVFVRAINISLPKHVKGLWNEI